MAKVMIATPAYDGRVHVPYATSLAETAFTLLKNNINVHFNITTSGSLLIAERNRILMMFMESDCSHLLCIDSDLGWPSDCIIPMILADKEFVGGVYPSRGERSFTFRPCVKEDDSIVTEGQLLKMEYIPAGFMLIKRSVIEKMMAKFPELYYEPKHETMKHAKGWLFFNCEKYDGEFWGEDYVFCRKAREAGVDLWVNPLIQFDHAGTKGALIEALTEKKEEAKKEPANVQAT
jgi:hypothetical protein